MSGFTSGGESLTKARFAISRWCGAPGKQPVKLRPRLAFADELQATLDALPAASMRPLGTPLSAWVELHIEQGPVLEREQIPVGVVTGVQGTCWLEVTISGRAAHAGTTPLAFRQDPMDAAVSLLKLLQESVMPNDADARLTVGRIAALPGSINAISSTAMFTLDIRHPQATQLAELETKNRSPAASFAAAQGCTATIVRTLDTKPVAFDLSLLLVIEAACAHHRCRRLLSGAFHDAFFIAKLALSAMLFVPSRDGWSHNEAEYTEPADCTAGAEVLTKTVLELAER
ncbi:hypothetical protein Sa4125_40780 [Aureimonas sp. SA4125]|uniref:hydantoinase/carbamoylase family amidase n=1 Tax=Aureimonas sp. SA4125 TaxID=2826993 RepID=UPI001CC7B480|nr:hydantoinase/carbamoylase family amidase [Aureimonas sp. SA4125]BDA86536.1 hypothetical protein Sa4125_40780 [Aureimonas sp. SA4125]